MLSGPQKKTELNLSKLSLSEISLSDLSSAEVRWGPAAGLS